MLSAVADPAVAGIGKSTSGTMIKFRSRSSATESNSHPIGLRIFISFTFGAEDMRMAPTIRSAGSPVVGASAYLHPRAAPITAWRPAAIRTDGVGHTAGIRTP